MPEIISLTEFVKKDLAERFANMEGKMNKYWKNLQYE